LVEHNLAKVGVAGSSPVSRSVDPDGRGERGDKLPPPIKSDLIGKQFFLRSHISYLKSPKGG